VVWRFESDTAFRVLSGHEDWVEALVRVPTRGGVPEEVCSCTRSSRAAPP
jgi:hypothetical protein